jgi:hypothetical protein
MFSLGVFQVETEIIPTTPDLDNASVGKENHRGQGKTFPLFSYKLRYVPIEARQLANSDLINKKNRHQRRFFAHYDAKTVLPDQINGTLESASPCHQDAG